MAFVIERFLKPKITRFLSRDFSGHHMQEPTSERIAAPDDIFWQLVMEAQDVENLALLCLYQHHQDYYNLRNIFTAMYVSGPSWWKSLGMSDREKVKIDDHRIRSKVNQLLDQEVLGVDIQVKHDAKEKITSIRDTDYLQKGTGIRTLQHDLEEFYWYPIQMGEYMVNAGLVARRIEKAWNEFVFLEGFSIHDYLELQGIPERFGIRAKVEELIEKAHPKMVMIRELEMQGKKLHYLDLWTLLDQIGDKGVLVSQYHRDEGKFITFAEIAAQFREIGDTINFAQISREKVPDFIAQYNFPPQKGIRESILQSFLSHPALLALESFSQTSSLPEAIRALVAMGENVIFEVNGHVQDGWEMARKLAGIGEKIEKREEEILNNRAFQKESEVPEIGFSLELERSGIPERFGIRAHALKLLIARNAMPLPKVKNV